MKIHNVRLGLATNSSSTHSLIFLPRADDHVGDDGDGPECFGWQRFVAASPERKRSYVALQVMQSLNEIASDEVADIVLSSLFGTPAEWVAGLRARNRTFDAYVDHQSVYDLPRSWDGKGIDLDFAREFIAFLMRDGLVILGDNDNEEEKNPLRNGGEFTLPIPHDTEEPLVCRRDNDPSAPGSPPFWTLFNRKTGAKIRFRFDDRGADAAPARTSRPELVDVKITDYCNIGCAFCYQDSTEHGEAATLDQVYRLSGALRDLQVFEVAIGGGEPTTHPQFISILGTLRSDNIVPNFTTRSLAWLHDPDVRDKVLAAAGNFAFSVGSGVDAAKVLAAAKRYGVPRERFAFQYVMGATSLHDLASVLHIAHEESIRLTLLGYKTTGRGAQVAPCDYSRWIDVLQKSSVRQVGIDTALAAESQEALAAAGIPQWQYHVEEGTFSMYVDLVSGKVGPSSYHPDRMVRAAGIDAATITDAFLSFGTGAAVTNSPPER